MSNDPLDSADPRSVLTEITHALASGDLPPAHRAWLLDRLTRIAAGEAPNDVFRLKRPHGNALAQHEVQRRINAIAFCAVRESVSQLEATRLAEDALGLQETALQRFEQRHREQIATKTRLLAAITRGAPIAELHRTIIRSRRNPAKNDPHAIARALTRAAKAKKPR